MEGTSINCRPTKGMLNPMGRIMGEKWEVWRKSRYVTTARSVPRRVNLERRTYKTPGALSKETRGVGRTEAGSSGVFTAYLGLHPHEPRYNNFPFLCDVTLEKRGSS